MADETPQPILVRAKKMVFYGGTRIRAGRTFSITHPSHFSKDAMEYVEGPAVDETEAARHASSKTRGPGGVELKQKRPGVKTTAGTIEPDPGI